MSKSETKVAHQSNVVHVSVPAEVYKELWISAFLSGRKVSKIAREAIEAYVPVLRKKRPAEIESLKEILHEKV